MKKVGIGFLLLLITTVFGLVAFDFFQKPTDVFVSPSRKYKVELYGNKRRPWLFTNTVIAKMFADEEFLASEEIHSGDAFDVSFESAYKFINWQNDNVLRFSYEDKNADKDIDKLMIFNNSSKKLKYIYVRFSENKYLIFGLNAGTPQVLTKRHSTAIADVYASGTFEDGGKIKSGASFPYTEKSVAEKPVQLCVLLEEGENNTMNNIVKITDCSQKTYN